MHVHTPSSHDHTSLYVHIISAAVHIMSHMQWCNVMWSHLWPQHISIRFWPRNLTIFTKNNNFLKQAFGQARRVEKKNATARLDLRVHLIVSKLRLGASHTCTRTHARAHMHAHTCTRTRAFKATERSEVLTSRGAKRRVRYEKEKNAFKPHFVRSLARSAPLPGCGVPSGRK